MENATSSKRYNYPPVNSATREIRLVTIERGRGSDQVRCYLNPALVDELPEYEALSYVWGDPKDRVSIILENCEFLVTRNLSCALESLRLPTVDRILWIDAICVNKDDLAERGAQVQLMRNIYQDAQRVVSWLHWGNDGYDAADASRFVAAARDHNFSVTWIEEVILSNHASRRRS